MSKTVKQHIRAAEKKALIRAALLFAVVGLPLLFWFLKTANQKAANEVVEPQKAYLSYLLLTNNFIEMQRSLNSISFSETIKEVTLKDEQGKTVATSVPKNSQAIPLGKEAVFFKSENGSTYVIEWTYQLSVTVIMFAFLLILTIGLSIAIFVRSELNKIVLTLIRPIELISSSFREISKVQSDLKATELVGSGYKEVDHLENEFSQLFQRLNAAEKRVIALAQQEALNNVAAQVVHDIRSPLSSLNILASEALLTDDKKAIFESAISRINDIANELLDAGKNLKSKSTVAMLPVNLTKIIEEIVLEKKIQFQKNQNLEFEFDGNLSEMAWSRVNAIDFARVVSNLVNNAAEALNNYSGKIKIGVRLYPDSISIFIQDDGRGMSPEVLAKLGKEAFTTGSGNGLGTLHAFNKVHEWGGKIEVFSKVGEGSTFNIQLIREMI